MCLQTTTVVKCSKCTSHPPNGEKYTEREGINIVLTEFIKEMYESSGIIYNDVKNEVGSCIKSSEFFYSF